jgi:sulfur-carrier protein
VLENELKVVLRLYATLRDYLPQGADTAGTTLDLPDGAMVPDALAKFDVPLSLAHIVLINGRHVLRPDRESHRLVEGDELAVFPAIGGG